MAILATLQELKDKIIASIKGASTNSSEKTKAIDHREVLIDVVDTLKSLIPVAINGENGIDGADGQDGADGIDGADGVGTSVYKETFTANSSELTMITHNLNTNDLHISLYRVDDFIIVVSGQIKNIEPVVFKIISLNSLIIAGLASTDYRIVITAY